MKKKQKAPQHEYVNGIRAPMHFYPRAAAKTAFLELVREGRCAQQELLEVLVLRAAAASPEEKAELFSAAHEGSKRSALARFERKYSASLGASVAEACPKARLSQKR